MDKDTAAAIQSNYAKSHGGRVERGSVAAKVQVSSRSTVGTHIRADSFN